MTKKEDFDDLAIYEIGLSRRYGGDFSKRQHVLLRHHAMLYMIVGMIVLFISWAAFAQLDEITRGDGKIMPSSETQVVQNLEGGIIDEFLVREGDSVSKGQILLRMHNVEASADFSAARQRYYSLTATIARLRAEAEGMEPVFTEEATTQVPATVAAEQNAYAANKRQLEGQLSVLDQQRTQKVQEMAEIQRKIMDLENINRFAQQERGMVAPMVEKGASTKMQLLQLDRQIAQQEAELNSLRLSLPRAESSVLEMEERANEMRNAFRAQAQQALTEKTAELNTLEETLGAYQDRSARTEIKSPVDGVINDIKVTTVGGVVQPGETIMEIVPLGDELLVEGRIRPADIAFLHPGQRAVVRLSAYDFSKYGALEGEVTDISADSFTNDNQETFYRVRVKTDQTTLEKDGEEHPIIPGMQATIDIVTGKKTVMEYLMKPFIRGARTALTER